MGLPGLLVIWGLLVLTVLPEHQAHLDREATQAPLVAMGTLELTVYLELKESKDELGILEEMVIRAALVCRAVRETGEMMEERSLDLQGQR